MTMPKSPHCDMHELVCYKFRLATFRDVSLQPYSTVLVDADSDIADEAL